MGNLWTTSVPKIHNYSINKSSSRKALKIGNYRLGRSLGRGSCSKLKVAINELTERRFLMRIENKKALKRNGMEQRLQSEIEILYSLNHPYIRKVYEIIHTTSDICIVYEYVCMCELFDLIVSKEGFVESEARRFFQQIICGVEYCHYKKIIHRDLRPENIVLDDNGDIRIQGFEISKKIKNYNSKLSTSCGAPNYAAPEIICDNLYIGQISDIWSIGVILYAMLCGMLPFDDESIPALFRKIKSGNYTIPKYISKSASDLIQKMLVVDPINRIKMNEIKQHCWFKKNLPKYLSKEYYEYNDGGDLIVGNGNYIELIQSRKSNTIYLPKGIATLIYKMLDPMFGVTFL
eukprot:509201_1